MRRPPRLEWVAVVALLALASCATTNVLVQAPEEFWATVEKLLKAMWEDVSTCLLFLGL